MAIGQISRTSQNGDSGCGYIHPETQSWKCVVWRVIGWDTDGKHGFGGPTRNRVWAANHRDMRPPRGGSIYVSGCSCAPRIIFGTCPFRRGTFLAFFLFCSRYSDCDKVRVQAPMRSPSDIQWDASGVSKYNCTCPDFNVFTRPGIFGAFW